MPTAAKAAAARADATAAAAKAAAARAAATAAAARAQKENKALDELNSRYQRTRASIMYGRSDDVDRSRRMLSHMSQKITKRKAEVARAAAASTAALAAATAAEAVRDQQAAAADAAEAEAKAVRDRQAAADAAEAKEVRDRQAAAAAAEVEAKTAAEEKRIQMLRSKRSESPQRSRSKSPRRTRAQPGLAASSAAAATAASGAGESGVGTIYDEILSDMEMNNIDPINIKEYLDNQLLSNSTPEEAIAKIPIIERIIAQAKLEPGVWERFIPAKLQDYFPDIAAKRSLGEQPAASATDAASGAGGQPAPASQGGYKAASPKLTPGGSFANDAKRLILEQAFIEGRRPKKIYEGERVAEPNPLFKSVEAKLIQDMTSPETAESFRESQSILKDSLGRPLEEVIRPTIESAGRPTIESIDTYMNPYEDRVLKDAMEQTTEDFIQNEMEPLLAKFSPGMGTYTGRFKDLRNRAFIRFGEKLKSLEYQMRHKGFQDSLQHARSDQERALQGATLQAKAVGEDASNKMRASSQLADLLGTQSVQEAHKTDRLMAAAQDRQRIAQSLLDTKYQDFMRQARHDETQTERIAALLNGLPAQGEVFNSSSLVPPPSPSPWSTLGGAAMSASSMFAPRDREKRAEGGEVGESKNPLLRLQEMLKLIDSEPTSSTSDRMWDFIGDFGRGIVKNGNNGLVNAIAPAIADASLSSENRKEKEKNSRLDKIIKNISLMNVLDSIENREKTLNNSKQSAIRKEIQRLEDISRQKADKLEERKWKEEQKRIEREYKPAPLSEEEKETVKFNTKKELEKEKTKESYPDIQEAIKNAYIVNDKDPWSSTFGIRSALAKTFDSNLDILAYEIARSEGITSDAGIRAIRKSLPNLSLEKSENNKIFNKLAKRYNLDLKNFKTPNKLSKNTNNVPDLKNSLDYARSKLAGKK